MPQPEDDDLSIEIESLRGELLAEMEAAADMRKRHAALLQRLDRVDKHYRDRVADLEAEVRRLKLRIRELEGGA